MLRYCSAYSGTFDTFDMDPECTQACTDLVEKRKREIFGVGSCDHQVPYRPVAWEQVPRYVPKLLKKGMLPTEALNSCMQLCNSDSLANECKEKCILDYNAIEPLKSTQNNPFIKNSNIVNTIKKNKNTEIVIGAFVLIIILSILFIYFKLKK
jgi:hypothetical protein